MYKKQNNVIAIFGNYFYVFTYLNKNIYYPK